MNNVKHDNSIGMTGNSEIESAVGSLDEGLPFASTADGVSDDFCHVENFLEIAVQYFRAAALIVRYYDSCQYIL